MNRFVKVVAVLAALAGAGTLHSAPASANGNVYGRHGHYQGPHRLHHHGFPFVLGFGRFPGAFPPHPNRYYVPNLPRRCQRVINIAYHHGRLAKIGGVMCYDRYGRPYVVAGSRYVIHYFR